jgi:threonine dehydrogenase-like Zn-dependent dehydrogenase
MVTPTDPSHHAPAVGDEDPDHSPMDDPAIAAAAGDEASAHPERHVIVCNLGAMMEKGLTIKSGQTHVQKYSQQLLEMIEEDKIDTTFLISHRPPLEEAPAAYKNFRDNQNEWTKVVLRP